MLPRIKMDKRKQLVVEDQLHDFACSGLRTLVMGQKKVSDDIYAKWDRRYQKAKTSNDKNKDDQMFELFDELEWDLDYVGSSAIEDLLQDQVPETIKILLEAGIRLWVLTGDKQETAIEIGKSCNLINEEEMELIILSSASM